MTLAAIAIGGVLCVTVILLVEVLVSRRSKLFYEAAKAERAAATSQLVSAKAVMKMSELTTAICSSERTRSMEATGLAEQVKATREAMERWATSLQTIEERVTQTRDHLMLGALEKRAARVRETALGPDSAEIKRVPAPVVSAWGKSAPAEPQAEPAKQEPAPLSSSGSPHPSLPATPR